MGDGVYFTDGRSKYKFNVAKNVLYKRFHFDPEVNNIKLAIHPDPLSLLDELVGRKPRRSDMGIAISLGMDDTPFGVKGVDYVVLPLYSPKTKKVHEKSGINQWNAGGRKRKLGEVYVSIPSEVRRSYPAFFPPRDTHFDLQLPNSSTMHKAKVCQEGGKALMTERNIELGRWLLSVIDPATKAEDFDLPPTRNRPYAYEDLVAIGSDSVIISRHKVGRTKKYVVSFGPLGSFEDFMQG